MRVFVKTKTHREFLAALNGGADLIAIRPHPKIDENIVLAKSFGRKIYLDISYNIDNTIIEKVLMEIHKAKELNIDGFLINNIGYYKYLRENYPDKEIIFDGKTYNNDSIKLFEADLLILPSDLSREEILQIKKKESRVAIYVHKLLKIRKFNTSIKFKDLCLIDEIPFLKEQGFDIVVISALKKEYHTYLLTKAYRDYIDEKRSLEDVKKDLILTTETDFTKGYYDKSIDVEYVSKKPKGYLIGEIKEGFLELIEGLRKEDKIIIARGNKKGTFKINYLLKNFEKVSEAFAGDKVKLNIPNLKEGSLIYKVLAGNHEFPQKKIVVDFDVIGRANNPFEITAKAMGREFSFKGKIVDRAKNAPLNEEVLSSKLSSLSNYPFELGALNLKVDKDIIIKFSDINFAKKSVIRGLIKTILEHKDVKFDIPKFNIVENHKKEIMIKADDYDVIKNVIKDVDIVFFDIFSPDVMDVKELCKKNNVKFYLDTPLSIHNREIDQIKKLIMHYNPDGILVKDLGLLSLKIKKVLYYNFFLSNNLLSNAFKEDKIVFSGHDKFGYFNDKNLILFVYGNKIISSTRLRLKNLTGFSRAIKNPYNEFIIYDSKKIDYLGFLRNLKNEGFKRFYLEIDDPKAVEMVKNF